jgi:probable phosphoglycerate mutase
MEHGVTTAASVTRLYLVRHGLTQFAAEDRFSGAEGVALSDEGRRQATALGERLRGERIDAVYASPLSRALETAHLVCACLGHEPRTRDGLREISHGHWEGLTRADVEHRFHDEYAAWDQDPFTFAPDGGESGVAVLARALPVIREIVAAHEGQRVLVVSHKATLRILISSVLGFDARGYRDRLDQSPACLNIIEFKTPIRARLMLFNDISHYQSMPRLAKSHLSKWWDQERH